MDELPRLPGGAVDLAQAVKPLVPDEIHGFKVEITYGPYPFDQPKSHRRAVYARLTPESDRARKNMKKLGEEMILGSQPVSEDGQREITEQGMTGDLGVKCALMALGMASNLAKKVVDATV